LQYSAASHRQLTKKFLEAHVAIRLLALLFERAPVQRLQTERADKMIRVVLLVERRHTPTSDQLTASGTRHAAVCKEVPLAVHSTIQFIKTRAIERQMALLYNAHIEHGHILCNSKSHSSTGSI